MRKKFLSLLLVATISAVSLFGCGGDNSNEQESDTKGENGKVSLTVWGSESDQDLLKSMVESFKQKYKGEATFDIKVDICEESNARDTVLDNIEGAADVFAFADDQLNAFVAGGVLDPVTNETVKKANNEKAVLAGTINNKLYAYPMTADNGYFMYYNKAYFNKEDLFSITKMVELAAQKGKKVTMDWSSGYYVYSFFAGANLKCYLNEDGVTNYCDWNTTITSVKGHEVAQIMLDIAASDGFINLDDEGFVKGVQDGTVIAGVNGIWNANKVQEAWGENFGAVKLPTYQVNNVNVQMGSFAGYKFIGVNSYSKNVEWAHKLADWLTNEQNQTLRFEKRGLGPSNINASKSEAVAASPAIQALLAQSEFSTLQRVGSNYWDPVSKFGLKMAAGNPGGEDLQTMLDSLVESITALVAK